MIKELNVTPKRTYNSGTNNRMGDSESIFKSYFGHSDSKLKIS